MKFLRYGRYGRIMGVAHEQQQRVLMTQHYAGCDCVDQMERAAGTAWRGPDRCKAHGNPWYSIRTDPIPEESDDAGTARQAADQASGAA